MKTVATVAPPPTAAGLSHVQGSLLVLFSGVIFSFGGLAFRSTDVVSPWQYLLFRGAGMVFATGALLAFRFRGRLASVIAPVQPAHIVAAGLLGLINCLFIVALDLASVAFVLFTQALAPVAAAFFTWLHSREPMAGRVAAATATSMVGVLVIVRGSLAEDVSPWALITLLIPVGFGLYATIIRSAPRVEPAVPVLMAGFVVIAVPMTVILFSGGIDISGRDAATAFLAGSFLLALPLAVFNTAQRVVPSSETTLLLLIEVVLAPLWVWVFVEETPLPATLIGGAIVTAAVVWLTMSGWQTSDRSISSRG